MPLNLLYDLPQARAGGQTGRLQLLATQHPGQPGEVGQVQGGRQAHGTAPEETRDTQVKLQTSNFSQT